MQPHKNNNAFTERLTACVERVGGKRSLAAAALISEAQLFRYLNGESSVPGDKLVSIAKAASVDAGWLLTGKGSQEGSTGDSRPAFRSELMVQVIQLLEELLVEFEKPFSPRQRARAITFLYNALRHEETKRKTEFTPQKFDMLKYVNFLAELRTEEELEVLNNSLNILEYSDKDHDFNQDANLLRMWVNLIARGTKGYYSSYPGQIYFERRAGGQLTPQHIVELQNLTVDMYAALGKKELDWLDLGCGNGRHMTHMYKHMPNIALKGIELSQLGYDMCKELMDAEKLPADSVTMGDARHMPYASESFDVVYSNFSLYCLPFIPGTTLGMEEAVAEARRVLRPGGVFIAIFPYGNWRDYSMPAQFMDENLAKKLAQNCQLEILKLTTSDIQASQPQQGAGNLPDNMRFLYNKSLMVQFRKR